MPKILIDLGKLKNIYTGLGQISFQYASKLATLKHSKFHFTYLVPENFSEKFGDSVAYQSLSVFKRYFPVVNSKYDLWHAIHQDSAFMPPKGVPYLLTIHDLNFLEEKSSVKARMRLKRLQKKVNRAAEITFISKFTEGVARQHLDIHVPTSVIYNGVNLAVLNDKIEPAFLKSILNLSINSLKKKEPLYFTIGVIKEKKNFHVLVQFMKNLSHGVLVIAGDNSDAYARSIQNEIEASGLQNRILMPGIVSDMDRAGLYENCDAFLFPSRVEGFGLPVIEAMSYGKPVFLSTCSSLPEVGGPDAFYWENFDPVYMATIFNEKMKTAMTAEKINSRKNRAAFFNWQTAVKDYLDLYEQIIYRM